MLCLLRDLSPSRCLGGPLSEQGSVFWIEIPQAFVNEALDRFPRLGYTRAVDQLDLLHRASINGKGVVRWRKRYFKLSRVYEEDGSLLREQSPDRREFVLLGHNGIPRKVRGYRGDGTRLGRRALPVCDARLLVSMARPNKLKGTRFLDPFAGAGGIAIEALMCGFSVSTTDIDPIVSPGLKQLGTGHCVADALRLPFPESSFHAIATEPPYHEDLGNLVVDTLGEIERVLMPGGKVVIFSADRHGDLLRLRAEALGLSKTFESPVDRKGTTCRIFAWEKTCTRD